MRTVELFAGAGGLALGADSAGFKHSAVVEWDADACATIRENNQRGAVNWPLFEGDVRRFDFRPYEGADLVAGGPPCQPFSIGGKHRGYDDTRNMFPEAVRAVREIRPRAVLVENVKGLLRPKFSKFFEYVLLQLAYPELIQRAKETWSEHLARLERCHTLGRHRGLRYNVVFRQLNAADYGVPQRRERVFIVAFRSDVAANWSFPEPTHSRAALVHSKWVTGEYWDRHKIGLKERGTPSRLAKQLPLWPETRAWQTVRDALTDIPDPRSPASRSLLNHVFNPGARVYGGHTGSPIDEPAKTLKAGDHGVPGGENMVAYPSGEVRYFTVRESARLQTFPDHFVFKGSWTEAMRQLGNAVPVALAGILAASIAKQLTTNRPVRAASEETVRASG